MHYKACACSLAVAAAFAATTASAAPTVSFKQPYSGKTVSGSISGSACEVSGSSIRQVRFYLDSTALNTETSSPWNCSLDTRKFSNGTHTLRAVAYDSAGASRSSSVSINIRNSTTTSTSGAPTVSLTSPASGATLSGTASCAANASDSGGYVSKVEFYVDGRMIASDNSSPYACSFDTRTLANGDHVFMARATDNSGLSATTQRSFKVANGTTSTPTSPTSPTGSSSSISSADIIHEARADVPFAQQSGYNTQVIATYLSANQIPETGINGTVLPNGERLRLGKHVDPLNSTKKALAFQVAPTDPKTSGSHRAELKFPERVEMNKTYWAAFSVYAYDWGSLPSGENAMFAMQLHAGNTSSSLSPSISVIAGKGGRTWWIDTRTSTSSTPTQSNSYSTRSADQPIRFGRWMDVVVKFKMNTSGAGFVQVWADGTQVMNYKGSVGYNTGSVKPYFKFGYYNWNGFSGTRKVLLRSPVVVADPTGSKYSPEALRAFVASR